MTVATHPASQRRSPPPPAARRNKSAMSARASPVFPRPMRTLGSRASSPSETAAVAASDENTEHRRLPTPPSPAVRDPQIPIVALEKRPQPPRGFLLGRLSSAGPGAAPPSQRPAPETLHRSRRPDRWIERVKFQRLHRPGSRPYCRQPTSRCSRADFDAEPRQTVRRDRMGLDPLRVARVSHRPLRRPWPRRVFSSRTNYPEAQALSPDRRTAAPAFRRPPGPPRSGSASRSAPPAPSTRRAGSRPCRRRPPH